MVRGFEIVTSHRNRFAVLVETVPVLVIFTGVTVIILHQPLEEMPALVEETQGELAVLRHLVGLGNGTAAL